MTVFKNHKMLWVIVLLAGIAFFSFCVQAFQFGWQSPVEVIKSIVLWFRLHLSHLFGTSAWLHYQELTDAVPLYGSVITRIRITAMTFLCGMIMALSGSVFQTVFRNPMAAPTMLGVNTGVSTGVLILVLQYGYSAANMMGRKYIYCYIGAGVMLGIVLLVGKLSSGRKRMSVFDLLIVASIISSMVSAFTSYYTLTMENDLMLIYQQILGAMDMDVSGRAFAWLGIFACIGIVPMVLMRFSFNAVSFETDDSRSLGINVYMMKILTMIFGTILIAAAMVHCGTSGMISLIAPFIGRKLCGANFKQNFLVTMLMGGSVLMLCKALVGLIPFADMGVPLGTMVNFVMLPFFVLIMAGFQGAKQAWVE